MKSFKFLTLALVAGLMITSCSDDDKKPEVKITSPNNGTEFAAGDTLNLVGNVTSEEDLSTIIVSSPLGLADTIKTFSDPNKVDFTYNIVLDSNTPSGDYSISVKATDVENNSGDDEIDVTIK